MNRKYAKNHKRGGDCVFPAPFESPPLNRQRGTVRGSPLIPSKGWQSFSKPASFLYQVYFLQKSLSAMLSIAPTSGGSRRGIAIPLLSLRVRVHRERGSRNTLSLCASLVTFSASGKSPHGVTSSRFLRKPDQNAPRSDQQYDTAATPQRKPHPGHAPHPLVISPAGHSS